MISDLTTIGPLDSAGADAVGFALGCTAHDTAEWLDRLLNSDFMARRQVLLTRCDGRLVGLGFIGHPQPMPPDWLAMRVLVAPDMRGRGVGRALHARLRTLAPDEGVTLRCAVFDSDPRDLEVARHWGFEVVQLSYTSALPLDSLPPASPLPPGVTVEPTRDLEFPDAAEVEAMYDRSQTNPERAQFVGDLAFLRSFASPSEALGAVLRIGGRPAALTWAVTEGAAVHVIYTGVDPAYRGRGYGALLKDRLHRMAREAGAAECRTNNEEHNAGIRRVNADLGYQVRFGEYWLQQRL